MRVLVSGAGGFVGAHVAAALARAGHERVEIVAEKEHRGRRKYAPVLRGGIDAVIQLSSGGVRTVLDVAHEGRASVFALLSVFGASSRSPRLQLARRGRAEELVRASGLPWVILRPEILWGPGDVFTNELAHLLRHLPFVPVPRRGPMLAPVYVSDAGRALVELLGHRDRWRREWSLRGPEELSYADVVERVARALGFRRRRPLRVPAWAVRLGAAVEERVARRPRETRALLDRLVAGHEDEAAADVREAFDLPLRPVTEEALRAYLVPRRSLAEQVGRALATP